MATPLPEKIQITRDIDPANLLPEFQAQLASDPEAFFPPKALTPAARTKYEAYYAEKARRKKPALPGVAQESLDTKAELEAAGASSGDVQAVFGYSIRTTLRPAEKEFVRIVKELAEKPIAAVAASTDVALVVADVAAKIPDFKEFVKPVEPIDPVVVKK